MMRSLDAVVSVDTAAAHAAGAVGTPLVLLLPPAPDWKWQPHASRPPWYESARVVHKAFSEQWIDAAVSLLRNLRVSPGGAKRASP